MTRVSWSALLILLTLVGVPRDAFTESSSVCHAIRRGESATHAAQRMTGDGRNAYQAWFQIMNPASRFVPKSQYNRIRAGWRACIIDPGIRGVSSNATHSEGSEPADVSPPAASSGLSAKLAAPTPLASADAAERASVPPSSGAADVLRTLGGADLTMVWLCAAIGVPWFGWRAVDGYLVRRRTAALVVRHFVERFVDEFERPLVRDDAGEPPVKSRLRHGARRGRFDILLAPGEGRRYPNLSDHKKNVEYDVARVMYALADHAFVIGAPYTNAEWIVVPFRFTADSRQAGHACISSL